jgi:hypothetical protein
MRTLLPIVAVVTLAGIGSAAGQTRCPELTRLRSEAVEASKPTARARTTSRCDTYIRASLAWSAVLAYANDHQDVCDISSRSLNDLEKYDRDAATARDNVCAGRPARPFPADIIQR